MRTLIIDNIDSFTYNLVQLMAEINDEQPTVLRNDAPEWSLENLHQFDNVIISPGPGRPERTADFGISRDTVLGATIPLLGVCLGHQGLCYFHGGSVGPSPEVFHGRSSLILHHGTDLFAGIPSPLRAVRYHSLMVTEVPDDFELVAYTQDRVVMAVRHRSRPYWGVQFHPESVCTEHGRALLRNFAHLTRRWSAEHRRPPHLAPKPTGNHRPEPARVSNRTLRVLTEWIPSTLSSELIFEQLFQRSEHSFWLDSSRQDRVTGRFSYMGDAAGPLARVVRANVCRGTVTIQSAAGTKVICSGFFDWLERDLASVQVTIPELPFDFRLGWVGYLGYELKAETGGNAAHSSPTPDAAMIFADRIVVFDHQERLLYLLALTDAHNREPTARWLKETRSRLIAMEGVHSIPAAVPKLAAVAHIGVRHNPQEYLKLIVDCQELIHAGEAYEICLTNMISARGAIDPWHAYRLLRQHNPTPFAALLRLGGLSVLSTSPERFIKVRKDGAVESKPIKGTRRRSDDPEHDRQLRKELSESEKDRAENLMIVDLVRNDLGRCAAIGSVQVSTLFDVESYSSVHQLVSTVRARLPQGTSALRCVRAAFPGGSMTGAPKVRTMEIIDRLEAGPRGVYSGALGYFSLDGGVDLSMVIRTLVVTPGEVTYGVGGAVVSLSDPDEELEETRLKATPLLDLLGVDAWGVDRVFRALDSASQPW